MTPSPGGSIGTKIQGVYVDTLLTSEYAMSDRVLHEDRRAGSTTLLTLSAQTGSDGGAFFVEATSEVLPGTVTIDADDNAEIEFIDGLLAITTRYPSSIEASGTASGSRLQPLQATGTTSEPLLGFEMDLLEALGYFVTLPEFGRLR